MGCLRNIECSSEISEYKINLCKFPILVRVGSNVTLLKYIVINFKNGRGDVLEIECY